MNEFKTEYSQINSKSIISEPSYQRMVDFSRVKKIVSNFNPNLVNPIKVSFRDGKDHMFCTQFTYSNTGGANYTYDATYIFIEGVGCSGIYVPEK